MVGYDDLVNSIIRPYRSDDYTDDDLYPDYEKHGVGFVRTDFGLRNERGLSIQCSHWTPDGHSPPPTPCVIYLHGNAGCRCDVNDILAPVLDAQFSVFAFDFTGSGRSDGAYVSLGWWEREDLKAVIAYLRTLNHVSSIALWVGVLALAVGSHVSYAGKEHGSCDCNHACG